MEKAAIKGIPYGVASFEEVRNENFYYVDKSAEREFLLCRQDDVFPFIGECKQILVFNPPSPFRQERVRKHDAGVLRYSQGRPLRHAVRRALDTGAPHAVEERFSGDLL